MLKTKRAIIWDWNGTLLNDAELCVQCMNELLSARNLPLLDHQRYRAIFTFPVREYYVQAGFDFNRENFEKPAMEFIDLYYAKLPGASLHEEAYGILNLFQELGYRQTVLSAMEHDSLERSLRDKGIAAYFDIITGINDHYAHSKLEIGEELVAKIGLPKEELLIIGDTLHDLEVGNALGVGVLLIANGHQSKSRLLKETPHVIDSLQDLKLLLDQPPVK